MTTTTKLNAKADPVVLPVDLRDYFAAKAMAAMLGSDVILRLSDRIADSTDDFHRGDWIASQAYQFADAMLAARGEE